MKEAKGITRMKVSSINKHTNKTYLIRKALKSRSGNVLETMNYEEEESMNEEEQRSLKRDVEGEKGDAQILAFSCVVKVVKNILFRMKCYLRQPLLFSR